jgi:hypothetical protein
MQDPKSPYPSILSPSSSTLFSDIELTKPIKIKFKTSSSTTSSPPKWKEVARELEAESRTSLPSLYVLELADIWVNVVSRGNQSPPSSEVGSPVAKQLNPRDRLVYGKFPMNEPPDLISCSKCHRPISRHAIKEHLKSCVKEKSTKKKNNDKVNGEGGNKAIPTGEIAVMPPKNKKRKHDDGILTLKFFTHVYQRVLMERLHHLRRSLRNEIKMILNQLKKKRKRNKSKQLRNLNVSFHIRIRLIS